MRILILVFCFLLSLESIAQLGNHNVLQTFKGKDLNAMSLIDSNPILEKITQKRKGLEIFKSSGEKVFRIWDEVETLNFGYNEYHLDTDLDGMSLSLYYKPYPFTSSEQILQYGIIKIPDSLNSNSGSMTYYKVIFLKDLVIK